MKIIPRRKNGKKNIISVQLIQEASDLRDELLASAKALEVYSESLKKEASKLKNIVEKGDNKS